MTDVDRTIEEAKAAVMPANLRFDESWEPLPGESGLAHAAFCVYRDYGSERSIRKAVEASEKDGTKREKRYRMWRNWSTAFRWRERVTEYDRYIEKLKQAERRKTIEEQGRVHRVITGKMFKVVEKKLDTMKAEDLSAGTVTEWVETAIRVDRDAAVMVMGKDDKSGEPKQGELVFSPEFSGL